MKKLSPSGKFLTVFASALYIISAILTGAFFGIFTSFYIYFYICVTFSYQKKLVEIKSIP